MDHTKTMVFRLDSESEGEAAANVRIRFLWQKEFPFF